MPGSQRAASFMDTLCKRHWQKHQLSKGFAPRRKGQSCSRFSPRFCPQGRAWGRGEGHRDGVMITSDTGLSRILTQATSQSHFSLEKEGWDINETQPHHCFQQIWPSAAGSEDVSSVTSARKDALSSENHTPCRVPHLVIQPHALIGLSTDTPKKCVPKKHHRLTLCTQV